MKYNLTALLVILTLGCTVGTLSAKTYEERGKQIDQFEERVKEKAHDLADKTKEKAKELDNKAKDLADQTKEKARETKEKAKDKAKNLIDKA